MPERTCSIDGCERLSKSRGWCNMHYQRWYNHGDPTATLMLPSGDAPADFHRLRMLDTDECVIWPHGRRNGYGQVRIDGRDHAAHRLALQLHTGLDGEGLDASHGPCHNPLCMNVRAEHVTWQDRTTNNRNKLRDGTDARGENHGMHKLTEDDVRVIRADTRVQSEIAADYGIDNSHVSNIKSLKAWGWLD